jgi:hypothetical protein
MDNLASDTNKQFRNLFDVVAAYSDGMRLGYDELGRPTLRALGPSVGDDDIRGDDVFAPARLTVLGPSVGDDGIRGDDVFAPARLTMLGPSVGDDQLSPV